MHLHAEHMTWRSQPLSLEAVDGLVEPWADLADHAIEKNIFLSPWFVRASIPLFKTNPEIISIWEGEQLISLFLASADRGYAKLPIGFHRSALHPHQFLATPLVRENCSRSFAEGVFKWIDALPQKCSFALFTHLTGEGEIDASLRKISAEQGRKSFEVSRFRRAAVEGGGNGMAHLRKSRRRSLERSMKKLEEKGPVTFTRLDDEAALDDWLGDFFRIENSGWKREGKTSIEQNPQDISFYRQIAADAFKAGNLNFFRLSVGDKPIAYTFDLVHGPFVYCMKCAHDLEFRKFAPGVLMEFETLKFYGSDGAAAIVDSCSSPDNQMLNDLWPERKTVIGLAIARKSWLHEAAFSFMQQAKLFLMERAGGKPDRS